MKRCVPRSASSWPLPHSQQAVRKKPAVSKKPAAGSSAKPARTKQVCHKCYYKADSKYGIKVHGSEWLTVRRGSDLFHVLFSSFKSFVHGYAQLKKRPEISDERLEEMAVSASVALEAARLRIQS